MSDAIISLVSSPLVIGTIIFLLVARLLLDGARPLMKWGVIALVVLVVVGGLSPQGASDLVVAVGLFIAQLLKALWTGMMAGLG